MKNRPLNMDAYGISYNAYMELYHLCQQYREKQRELEGMLTIRGSMPTPIKYSKTIKDKRSGNERVEEWGCVQPRGSGQTSDPVFDAVIRREKLQGELRQIEQSAIEASPDLYQYLLRAVTTKDGYRAIRPPCGYHQFAEIRRKFFYILWEMRQV